MCLMESTFHTGLTINGVIFPGHSKKSLVMVVCPKRIKLVYYCFLFPIVIWIYLYVGFTCVPPLISFNLVHCFSSLKFMINNVKDEFFRTQCCGHIIYTSYNYLNH